MAAAALDPELPEPELDPVPVPSLPWVGIVMSVGLRPAAARVTDDQEGRALHPQTGAGTRPGLSSIILPRDRRICRARTLSRDPNRLAANGLASSGSPNGRNAASPALPCMFDSSQYAILAGCREESYAMPEALTS